MLLLEQDITRKRQVDNVLLDTEKDLEFKARENKRYEIEAIIDSAVNG